MTEKAKIVEILKENFMARKEVPIMITHTEKMQVPIEIWKICQSIINGVVIPYFADTLIENSIGDIAEWKARAEVAERALKNVIKQYKRCDELGACEECSERQGCVKALCDKYKQQAEREIEEERK